MVSGFLYIIRQSRYCQRRAIMDLSFQEKSAWGLLIGIVAVSIFYFPMAFRIVANVTHPAPLIAISVVGVVALIFIEAVYHAIIAAPSGEAPADERDQLIDLKAERIAGFALGVGLFSLVGWIIVRSAVPWSQAQQPLTIAVIILLTLTVSEIVKLICQIWYYRTGV